MRENADNLYKKLIVENRLKDTKPRRFVYQILLMAKSPMTAQQIIKSIPTADPSSIYRTLDGFTKANIVHVVPRGFKTLYELSEVFLSHHHHITCQKCNQSVAIQNKEIEKMVNNLTIQANMKPTYHHIELYGICCNCQKKDK